MGEIPDFWRTEVFHPLSVHFPIALLLVAFLFKLVALWYRREVWEKGGTILLALGVIGIWIAIYTGNQADGVVSRKLCDPTILKEHENLAWTAAWLFSAGLSIDLMRFFPVSIFKSKGFLSIAVIILAIGNGVMFYTGHLGAQLVYQQAAGVYVPTSNCGEFE
jgi:uncharacterized membrane protein